MRNKSFFLFFMYSDYKSFAFIFRSLSESLEPIGSKAPALIGEMKRGWKETITRSSVVLTCPAQGYPVPSFR